MTYSSMIEMANHHAAFASTFMLTAAAMKVPKRKKEKMEQAAKHQRWANELTQTAEAFGTLFPDFRKS